MSISFPSVNSAVLVASAPTPLPQTPLRTVFGSDHLRSEFAKFLKTIFYQLDENSVFREMDKILADPQKTDQQVYEELVTTIDQMRRRLPALFYQLKSLSVLQKGTGSQAATLMADFRGDQFHNYLEIYFRRHFKTIQKTAGLTLDGKIFAACDNPYAPSLQGKMEAESLLSAYPYQHHVPLNDADCTNPDTQPEKTHRPIGNEVQDQELDLIACLGGLHHIPTNRVDAFVQSLFQKLRPGAVLLLREHDAHSTELQAMASAVHTFVNATSGVHWDVESREVRDFRSNEYWTGLMERHGFKRVLERNLVLQDDPTLNGMSIFVRSPTNLPELQAAARYRKSCVRPIEGTKATWIEWGNVRYSKQYAEFVQTRHSYAFDFIGHLRQHWTHFSQFMKHWKRDCPSKRSFFPHDFSMNLFILISTTFECVAGYASSLPSQLIARIRHGVNWRNATDLTALEKYEAQVEKEYSESLDHTPFYMFPYLSKIKGLWSTIWNSNESAWTKFISAFGAARSTATLLCKQLISLPIRKLSLQDGQYIEPDRIAILIHDPQNQFQTGQRRIGDTDHAIEVLHQISDGHKIVLVPRYRPFTTLCKELANHEHVRMIEIGSQEKVTVDVVYGENEESLPSSESVELLYEVERLQDSQKRRYATYQVHVAALAQFQRSIGTHRIEYVHE